jgi:hypothetical protein
MWRTKTGGEQSRVALLDDGRKCPEKTSFSLSVLLDLVAQQKVSEASTNHDVPQPLNIAEYLT